MCKHGTTKEINVIRRANRSVEDGWHKRHVDACIADHVQLMNERGIITLGCCCGHGEYKGHILVSKGSEILLKKYGYEYEHDKDAGITADPFNKLIVFADTIKK